MSDKEPCQDCAQTTNVPSGKALVTLAITCAIILLAALAFMAWFMRRDPGDSGAA